MGILKMCITTLNPLDAGGPLEKGDIEVTKF